MNRAASADPSAPAPPPVPPAAAALFADRLPQAEAYASLLASEGPMCGLLGPREVPRIWDRHLLNCAVLTDLVPIGARVVDVGSGAGLPGLVMAIRRPDLRVDLVEPMLRRTRFLDEAVRRLELAGSVRVIRGRADDDAVVSALGPANWVVARAVAPLDRLVKWCLPLLAMTGRLLALKGATAQEEVATHRDSLRRLGVGEITVRRLGDGMLADPTWVVSVSRAERHSGRPRRSGR
ncbi:MAG: rRNA (guanine527-N7)-methyltransferase [Pseudonocardiales bacterium]|nr:rRNA (guanine527-N7)-methyltransferase [Pseudonocardiales bacterium]